MSFEGLIISFVLAGLGLAWIIYPFLQRSEDSKDKHLLLLQQYAQLKQDYKQVVAAIQSLEEDHSTDKISDDDYKTDRQTWAQKAVAMLKELDHMEAKHPELLTAQAATRGIGDNAVDEAIENAVAQYLNE